MKPIKLYLEQIFHRYTFRLQGKSIFAVLLEWPVNGSVVLNEPVVTQGQTQVRYEDTHTHTHYFIKYMKCHKFYDYKLCFCLHGVWYLWLTGALKLTGFLLSFVIPIFDAGWRYSTRHDLSDSQLMRLHIVICYYINWKKIKLHQKMKSNVLTTFHLSIILFLWVDHHVYSFFLLKVELLGYGSLQWEPLKPSGLRVLLPQLSFKQMPCQWAWTLKLTGASWNETISHDKRDVKKRRLSDCSSSYWFTFFSVWKKSNGYFLNDQFFIYNIFKNVFFKIICRFFQNWFYCFNCKRDIVFTQKMCFK